MKEKRKAEIFRNAVLVLACGALLAAGLGQSCLAGAGEINAAVAVNTNNIETMDNAESTDNAEEADNAESTDNTNNTENKENKTYGTLEDNGAQGAGGQDMAALQEGQTIYGIGSVSKIFPAVAIMQLAEQGRLDLDTPLTEYIPQFVMADERYKEITPRMLLDHSAGLMGTSDYNAMLLGECDSTSHDTFLERLKPQRLKAAPGAFSVYSNDGFTLAEILVEEVSGMTFTDYIEQNISSVLGMQDTKTPVSSFDRSRQAKIYYDTKNIELPPEYLYEIGAGGILSTAEDLCRFGQIFTREGTAVLSQESVMEMETGRGGPSLLELEGRGTWEYGLGWDTVAAEPFAEYGIKAVSKGGDTSVYHGNLTVLPEENMAAAVLTSGGSSSIDQLLASEMLLEVLEAEGKIEELSAAALPDIVEDADLSGLNSYEGYYVSQGLLKVRFQDGSLYVSTLDQSRNVTQEYQPAEGDVFVSANGDYISSAGELVTAEGGIRGKTIISFREGSNGEKYICINSSETRPGLGTSYSTIPFGQKVEGRELSGQVKKAWEEREGKKYYLIGEKSSSSGYLSPVTTVRMPADKGSLPGYFRNAEIIDDNHAAAFLELPVMLGRDLLDYYFYEKDGKDYLDLQNGGEDEMCLKKRYISEESMDALPGCSFDFTMETGENTRWYTIPEELSGTEVSVEMPESAELFAYDARDRMTTGSLAVNAPDTLILPKDGKIVFVGSPGDSFTVR